MSSLSEMVPDGDAESDEPGARGRQYLRLTQSAGPSRATPRSRSARRSIQGFADRVAARRDRNAAALMLYQAARLSEAAAADRDLAALHRHHTRIRPRRPGD